MVAKVPRVANRLYVLYTTIAQPVCMLVHKAEEAWRWHARLGHLNFHAFKMMANQGWVRSLPCIQQVDQLCDGCLVGKHRRAPFPEKAEHRSTCPLELVHGDLCGPIIPTTPGGEEAVSSACR
jgi:hypothetical protein